MNTLEEVQELFHGSPEPITEIHSEGVFGGLHHRVPDKGNDAALVGLDAAITRAKAEGR